MLRLQQGVRQIRVDDAITEYLLDIVHMTRRSEDLHVGVSTRGALTLYRAAQSLALVSGRDFVIPDDIKTLAVPVLAHRVLGKSFLQAGEFGAAEAIIRDIVDRARVPSLMPGHVPARADRSAIVPPRGVETAMSVDEKTRSPKSRGLVGRLARGLASALVPTERTIVTREGWCYFGVMVVLLAAGLYQQVNLILLVSTLAAGPFLTSWIGSRCALAAAERGPPGSGLRVLG